MIQYDYTMFCEDVEILADQCRAYAPDLILAVARGGLVPAQFLAYALDVRRVEVIQALSYDDTVQRATVSIEGGCDLAGATRVLIVDDIIDSGKTADAVTRYLEARYPALQLRWAALWSKPASTFPPDYHCREADAWVRFFWERADG